MTFSQWTNGPTKKISAWYIHRERFDDDFCFASKNSTKHSLRICSQKMYTYFIWWMYPFSKHYSCVNFSQLYIFNSYMFSITQYVCKNIINAYTFPKWLIYLREDMSPFMASIYALWSTIWLCRETQIVDKCGKLCSKCGHPTNVGHRVVVGSHLPTSGHIFCLSLPGRRLATFRSCSPSMNRNKATLKLT